MRIQVRATIARQNGETAVPALPIAITTIREEVTQVPFPSTGQKVKRVGLKDSQVAVLTPGLLTSFENAMCARRQAAAFRASRPLGGTEVLAVPGPEGTEERTALTTLS